MPALRIEARQVDEGMAYVNAVGSLDAETYEKMESNIQNLFKKGFFKLIVHLEHVDYISSAGAGVFIGALTTAQEHNGNILLLSPSTAVYDVFEVLGLLEIFPSAKSLDEATAILRQN